jgi:Lon protease-like protein
MENDMDDNEKNRAEYVARLEAQFQHAQSELAKYREIAEKWQPVLHAEISTTDKQVRFTLSFGGKRSTATVQLNVLQQTDVTTATSAIVDALVQSNVADRLREMVLPEVQRIQPSLKAIGNAGQW